MERFIKPHKHKGIVKLLLVSRTHPHVHQGGTPLSWATECGQTSGIMLLRESVDAEADLCNESC